MGFMGLYVINLQTYIIDRVLPMLLITEEPKKLGMAGLFENI